MKQTIDIIKSIRLVFIATIIPFIAACSADKAGEAITEAENAVAMADFDSANKICRRIVGKDSLSNLSVDELCRLTLLFMEISEQNADTDADTNEDVALATRCLNKAISIDADSVAAFSRRIPAEKLSLFSTVVTLNKTLSTPREFFLSEPTDSITYIDTDSIPTDF